MVVDLPAPLRPSRAVACPAYAARSTPATASTSPKLTWRLRTSTAGGLWVMRSILPQNPRRRPGNGRAGSGREGLALRHQVAQVCRGPEPLAVGVGQLVGAVAERGQADGGAGVVRVLVAGHKLGRATGVRREADAHDRTDVGRGGRLDDPLLEALRGLERLREQHPVLDVLQRDLLSRDRERLTEAGPQSLPLAGLVVLEEAGALEPRRAAELDHLRDHDRAGVLLVPRAVTLGGLAGGLADLGHQLHVELVGDCLLYTSDAADDLLCVDLG